MKITKNKLDGFTVTLEMEEDYAEVEKAMEPAFKEVVKDFKYPGFRPGKIPRPVFEKQFGTAIIVEQASTIVMNECYRKALEETKLLPVDYPKDIKVNKLEKGKPFSFSLKVDIEPEVKAKKYKGLKVEKGDATLKEEEINAQLERLRENFAEFKDADRPVKSEDLVTYSIKAFDGDKAVEIWTKENSGTRVGMKNISEEFDAQLIGMKKNEPKTFTLKMKDDHFVKEVAGKEIRFEVTVTALKEKALPELNDEFAKKVAGKEKLQELIDEIKEHYGKHKAEEVEQKFKDELMKELVKNNDFELPPAMIETETENMLNTLSGQLGQSKLKLEDYAALTGKTLDQMKDEYKTVAADRVKIRLLLKAIAKEEEIKPTDADIDKELEKIANDMKKPLAEVKEKLSEHVREHITGYLTDEKTLEFLVNNAKIK